MQHDQRHRSSNWNLAATCLRGNVDGCVGGSQFRERHLDWISDAYLDVRISYRPKGGRNSRNTRQGSWKTDGNFRSRIAIRRSVLARHRTWLAAAIEGGADPSKIERGEVGSGGWI